MPKAKHGQLLSLFISKPVNANIVCCFASISDLYSLTFLLERDFTTTSIICRKASGFWAGVCFWCSIILRLPQPAAAMISTHSAYPEHSSQSIPVSTPHRPVYNSVNPNYPGLRVVNSSPPVFCVDHFLSPQECHFLIESASDAFTPAPVVGKGHGEISHARTSSTCYLAREDVPDLMRKVSALTGKPMEHCELPQVGRYFTSQQYVQVRRSSLHYVLVHGGLKHMDAGIKLK